MHLTEQHVMWNAGVVGIPAAGAGAGITLALRICDDLSRQQVTPRLIEQFATKRRFVHCVGNLGNDGDTGNFSHPIGGA